jgi:hypothetical protein
MPLILAIEPDPRQAAQIAAVVRNRVGAELMLADTTEGALDVIGDRVPDLVLVPALLSPQDDAALAAALRVIAAAAHVRTLTIPVLSAGPKRPRRAGMLAKWRRGRSESPEPEGCDPAIFAEQITVYLKEAAAERASLEHGAAVDEPVLETPQAAHVLEPPQAAYALETPQAAYVLETPQAAYVLETPQAAYILETPLAGYALETPQAAYALESPQVASEVRAPAFSTEEPSIVFEEPTFFVEDSAATVEETAVVSVEPVHVEQEPALVNPAPMLVIDEPLVVEEPELSFELSEATGRDINLSETGDHEAEEDLVFELTLDDANIMLFDAPPATRIGAPTVMTVTSPPVASPPVASEELTSADEVEERAAAMTATDALAASNDRDHMTAPPARHTEHWMPMSSGIERLWPPLEGVVAEFVDALELLDEAELRGVPPPPIQAAAAPLSTVQPLAAVLPPPPASGETPKSEWVELIESLRQDIERLRATPPQPPPSPAPQPAAVPSDELVTAPKAKRRAKAPHPIQDEWGFFDPEQCGFAALLAKLDEMTESGDETEAGGN